MSINDTLNMKQLMDIIIENHLENATFVPFSQSGDIELRTDDAVVVIDRFINHESLYAYASYQYPPNWKDLDDVILEKSIRYFYSDDDVSNEDAIKQGIVLFNRIPWSRVQFVPTRIYRIISTIIV